MYDGKLFRHLTMVEYGVGATDKVGEKAKELGGATALVVTDPGVRKTGLVDRICGILKSEGIESVVFDKLKANPEAASVDQAIELLKKEQCDVAVAVGGGSPIDVAKCAIMVAANGGNVLDYELTPTGVTATGVVATITKRPIPLIAIPTTSGTGSEVTIFAVISDPARRCKCAFGHPYYAPVYALCDPEVTVSVPSGLTAATGMDALTHAIEAYTTKGAMPQTDVLALAAIKSIANSLRQAVAYGANLKARDGMMMGSMLAGMAFNSALLGGAHGLAMPLGGIYDTPHGLANAIVLPWVMEYNLIACPEKFATIAEAMGEAVDGLSMMERADRAVAAVRRLSKDIGIPSLGEAGCREDDIPMLAELAIANFDTSNNPRPMRIEDIVILYQKAF